MVFPAASSWAVDLPVVVVVAAVESAFAVSAASSAVVSVEPLSLSLIY